MAGSQGMLGAAVLSAGAALRSGCGLVTVGIAQGLNDTLQTKLPPEVMTCPLPETEAGEPDARAVDLLLRQQDRYTVAAVGPGLSSSEATRQYVLGMVEGWRGRLVLDAGALNALAHDRGVLKRRRFFSVLTPHPGEMRRLIKEDLDARLAKDDAFRQTVAKDFARAFQCVLVLKGHKTVVASPEGEIFINDTGNPGMATAGSGDVLTGIIAAFWAQGCSAFEAARYGVFAHGLAGDLAAGKQGELSLIASDIIAALPSVLRCQTGDEDAS